MNGQSETKNRKEATDAGFTLVEILVALTLLAVVSLILYSSLHFGVLAWDRGATHSRAAEEVSLAQLLLQREISNAYPLFIVGDATHKKIDFGGRQTRLNFLAPAPALFGAAGMVRFTVSQEPDGATERLVVSVRQELANDNEPPLAESLISNLRSVEFSYYGSDGETAAPQWVNEWVDRMQLPQLIRIRVRFPERDVRVWPDLIVKPTIDIDEECIYDALTKSCRRR